MRWLCVSLVVSLGCAPAVEPAPEGLSANVRWFWSRSDAADDATVLDATSKLSVAGKLDTFTTPSKAAQRERLAPADLAIVGLQTNDPSKARGLLVVNVFDCRMDVLADLLSADEQMTLYPDSWTSHVRQATSDRQAFLDKRAARYSWDADVSVTFPIADAYQSKLKGTLRRVVAPADLGLGPEVLVARLWLTAPAVFPPSSTSAFNQNYEIEIFWEPTPGRIAHGYGMWREVKVGAFNLTLEEEDLVKVTLDNLVSWDGKTAALCARR
jgi:hypothetical protein